MELYTSSPILLFCYSNMNLKNDICIFFFLSAASGFQTGIKRKREEEDDGDLNIDGDDSEEYGKPQYPIKLIYLSVILVCLGQTSLPLSNWFTSLSNWFTSLSNWFTSLSNWFNSLSNWFTSLSNWLSIL